MNKKQTELHNSTKSEIKRQIYLSASLCGFGGMALLKLQPLIWVLMVASILTLGGFLLFLAKRGFWIPLWRGFSLFFGLNFLGLTGFYIIYDQQLLFNGMSVQTQYLLIAFFALSLALSVFLYFVHWIRPHWTDSYESNINHKINLENGTYSVVIDWATRRGASGKKSIWLSGLICAGPAIAATLKGSGSIQAGIMICGSMFLIWVAFSMSLTEFYNVYKLIVLEKLIGKPLIIETFIKGCPEKVRTNKAT